MRRILLLTASLFFLFVADAQIKRNKDYLNGNGDTTWREPSGPKTRSAIDNGDVLIHKESGKYDLYASYKNKKLTNYYAIDTKGNKLPVTVVARPATTSGGKFKCYACVKVCNEAGKCVESCVEDGCPEGMGVSSTSATIRAAN